MTDFRALCAELVEAWDDLPWEWESDFKGTVAGIHSDLYNDVAVARARALLAEPVAEGPTDDEVDAWADANDFVQGHGDHPCGFWIKDDDLGMIVRAALARWGHPTPQPVAVSERLPGPEDCDEQGQCWWYGEGADMFGWTLDTEGASYYRAKFWLPANALPIPDAR